MRPLSLPPLACALLLLAASVHAERPDPPAGRRAPKALRDKVCAEGAYLSAAPGREEQAAAGASDAPNGESVPDAERGEGRGRGGMWRVRPGRDDASRRQCGEQFESFFSGHAGDFTIAPAVDERGQPVTPEQAAGRSVSLASLSRLSTTDAGAIERFFENRLKRADVAALSGFDQAAGRGQAPGNATFVNDGGQRVPFEFTPRPRATGLAAEVPGPEAPRPIQPRQRAWDAPPPADYGGVRQRFADWGAQLNDYWSGSPVARAEGRPILPPPQTNYPTGQTSIQSALIPAPGLNLACGSRCFGTADMLRLLTAAGDDYQRYMQGAAMRVGDISQRGGGPISGHVSHQKGVDVDISFVGHPRTFDVQANTMIVAAIARNWDLYHIPGVQYILVDASKHAALYAGLDRLVSEGVLDAERAAKAKRALRHWPNHNDHFHLRIRQR
ncbi:MAG: penicillin-insensitive murein endopeptidase [Elusimicrobiota bacterium]|nr:penicillin-insensitive murein endopeptidase [Elusimicrobiota bacterium]